MHYAWSKPANDKTKLSTKQLITTQSQPLWYEWYYLYNVSKQFANRKQTDRENKKKKKGKKPAAVNAKTKSSQKLATPQSQSTVDQKIQ